MPNESIDIRPSAQILKILGKIDYDNWQCLAELIDNAFDDFLEIKRAGLHWPDGFKVSISLPQGVIPSDSEVVVTDSGRGMDLETLNNAVRAGWSSNDPFSKLGLFGMGFNVATARLGQQTTVLTTRSGDSEWVGVHIDVDAIGNDFQAPVVRAAKEDPRVHGTRVAIKALDRDRAVWLSRNAQNIRLTLGDVYTHLIANERFSLIVNGVQVVPRRRCAWGANRSITYGVGSQAEQIPAVVQIDQSYPSMANCTRCRNWQEIGRGECVECGSTNLVERERRISGWLGIQRYLSKNDYGIDFFRNGRKILRNDKRLFSWTDPNDPLAVSELEYPVELNQGRIIGEIHLDHVPVNYQKNGFEWSDRNWIAAVEYLRGRQPLLPKRAEQLQLPHNTSPLGLLFKGYRRADPGYRSLVPGDGATAIHDQAKKWADKFYEGDPEYQEDTKWWEAVVFHEQQRLSPQPAPAGATAVNALERLGVAVAPAGPSPAPQPNPTPTPQLPETEQERIARFRAHGIEVPSLTGEFGLLELGAALRLTTFRVSGTPVADRHGNRVPVYLTADGGSRFSAFIDETHPVFADFGDSASDHVFIELAEHLKVRARSELALSQIFATLKDRHASDQKIDLPAASSEARTLLRVIRERMSGTIVADTDRAWQVLHSDERTATETNLISEGASTSLSEAQLSGQFILYAPAMSLPRVVEEWPEAFLDGRVFAAPYSSVVSPGAKRLSLGRLVGYLYDAARLAAVDTMPPKELLRARASLGLLRQETGPETE